MVEVYVWETIKAFLKPEDVERFEPFKEQQEGSSEYIIRLVTIPTHHEDAQMIEWEFKPYYDDNCYWIGNPNPSASVMLHQDDHQSHARLFPHLADGPEGEHQG